MTLPPIREWWPELSPDAREELLGGDLRHLGEVVREEVREITGAVVGMKETLTDEDHEYLRSQADSSDDGSG